MRRERTTAPNTTPTSTGHARVPALSPGDMAEAMGNCDGPTVVSLAVVMEGLEDIGETRLKSLPEEPWLQGDPQDTKQARAQNPEGGSS